MNAAQITAQAALNAIPELTARIHLYEPPIPGSPLALTGGGGVPGDWSIELRPMMDWDDRPTVKGWQNFLWVTWFAHNTRRVDAFSGTRPQRVELTYSAAHPGAGEPGTTLHLWVKGHDSRQSVDAFVAELIDAWNDDECSPAIAPLEEVTA